MVKFGKIRVAVLEAGAFFGEAGFLCDPTLAPDEPHRRRWASVYSNTYCDVRYISRAKFEEVLQLCPDVSIPEVGRGLGGGGGGSKGGVLVMVYPYQSVSLPHIHTRTYPTRSTN